MKRDYLARQVTGAEKATWWARAVESWPDYAKYQTKTTRRIPSSCSRRGPNSMTG